MKQHDCNAKTDDIDDIPVCDCGYGYGVAIGTLQAIFDQRLSEGEVLEVVEEALFEIYGKREVE